MDSTQEKILIAAETHFAKKGYTGTTMRDITEEAGVNLAAINYHFGSKEALFREMLVRRVEPINRRRIELLDQALEESEGGVIPVEIIFGAILGPLADALESDGELDERLMGILSQSLIEPSLVFQKIHQESFTEFKERFFPEMVRTMPDLEPVEVVWRVYFAFSTMMGAFVQHSRISQWFPFIGNAGDVRSMMQRLLEFIAAGLMAEPGMAVAAPSGYLGKGEDQ